MIQTRSRHDQYDTESKVGCKSIDLFRQKSRYEEMELQRMIRVEYLSLVRTCGSSSVIMEEIMRSDLDLQF